MEYQATGNGPGELECFHKKKNPGIRRCAGRVEVKKRGPKDLYAAAMSSGACSRTARSTLIHSLQCRTAHERAMKAYLPLFRFLKQRSTPASACLARSAAFMNID